MKLMCRTLEKLFFTDEPVYGWEVVGGREAEDEFFSHMGRWHDNYWFVLRDTRNDLHPNLWGVVWGSGLTEYQEDHYPWDSSPGDTLVELTPIKTQEVKKVIYGPAH